MVDKAFRSQYSLKWRINAEEGIVDLNSYKFYKPVVLVSNSLQRLKAFVLYLWWKIWQIGSDDPRRVVHSCKVGLALSLVSLFYFVRPLFDSVGENAIWAIITVAAVLQFTAGATVSKGLNRCFATLLAGSLGFVVGYLSRLAGHNGGRIVLGISVFVVGAASTFSRFIPKIKKRYDYGVVIFILTFTLIAISAYRVQSLFKMTCQRVVAIMIGSAMCIFISFVVFPIWAGDDLHSLIISNLEVLAASIEGCVGEFFKEVQMGNGPDGSSKGYKCVLNSKTSEESLMNFTAWEPCHGKFFMGYPWNEYVKIGVHMRYCAYSVEALNGILNSEIKAPDSLKESLKKPCMETCRESACILRELAKSMRTMTKSTDKAPMIHRLATMVVDLQCSISSLPDIHSQIVEDKYMKTSADPKGLGKSKIILASTVKEDIGDADTKSHESIETGPVFAFVEAVPVATFAFLVIEIAARLENIILAVEVLAEKAKFKNIEIKGQVVHAAAMPILVGE